MSNRTFVCLNCWKSYRRDQNLGEMGCPICHQACEYVHWKIRIPSPKRKRQWKLFWNKYKAEKRLLEEFQRDPTTKVIELDILNQKWVRD